MKLLEEKLEVSFHNLRLHKDFLDVTPRAQEKKKNKIDYFNFVKIKILNVKKKKKENIYASQKVNTTL